MYSLENIYGLEVLKVQTNKLTDIVTLCFVIKKKSRMHLHGLFISQAFINQGQGFKRNQLL